MPAGLAVRRGIPIERFIKRAKAIATYRGYSELADDFAQEVICQFSRNPARRSTLDQLFVDYLRQTFGDARAKRSSRQPYRQRRLYDLPLKRHPITSISDDDRLRRVVDVLEGDKKFIIMRFLAGFTMMEIGDALGISESRICQIIHDIKNDRRVRPIVHCSHRWA